jgi:hypothetical protein
MPAHIDDREVALAPTLEGGRPPHRIGSDRNRRLAYPECVM